MNELAKRQEAIDLSGWGRKFTFVQPANLNFWVYVLVVAWGGWQLLRHLAGTAFYAPAYITGLLTFGVLAVVIWAVLRFTDKYERQPAKLIILAFIWGGIAATFAMAISANTALLSLLGKSFGQAFQTDWGAGLVAPIVEETSKAAGFLLLMGLAPQLIRSVYDGLIIGAFIGLGFEIIEDITYSQTGAAAQFGAAQVSSSLDTFALRALTSLVSHALYTALFCAGLVLLIGTVAQPRRWGPGLTLVLAAFVAHGVWDSTSALGRGTLAFLLFMLLDVLFCIVMLVFAIKVASKQVRGWRRDILAPEVGNGTITPLELDAVCGGRKERKALLHNVSGHHARKETKRVMHAAADLAEDLAIGNGRDTPAVVHSRAEIARLRSA
jgi:RsiW-degrading membrane proteinase PrsW (M82 family)